MRLFLLCTLLILGLAACCPTPQLGTHPGTVETYPTAFVAQVVGASADQTRLHLRLEGQERVTVAMTETTRITSAQGKRLELGDLSDGGMNVYLVGRLQGQEITAEEIHVLGG